MWVCCKNSIPLIFFDYRFMSIYPFSLLLTFLTFFDIFYLSSILEFHFFSKTYKYIFSRKLFSSQSVGLLPRRLPRVRDQIEPEGEPRNRVPETKPLIELRRISKESSEFRLSTGWDWKETSSFTQVCWNWNLWQCLTLIKPGFNVRTFLRS